MSSRCVRFTIDEVRYRRLMAEARARKVSPSQLIGEAIDLLCPPSWSDRFAAGQAILGAEPMHVPEEIADLKRELDEARNR
jgi:hypothetical protein